MAHLGAISMTAADMSFYHALASLTVVVRCLQHSRHQRIPTLDTPTGSAVAAATTVAEGTFPGRSDGDW